MFVSVSPLCVDCNFHLFHINKYTGCFKSQKGSSMACGLETYVAIAETHDESEQSARQSGVQMLSNLNLIKLKLN